MFLSFHKKTDVTGGNLIFASLKPQNEIRQIAVSVEVEFFSEPVTADFDTPGGDVHQRGDFFTWDIEFEIGAKF